MFSKIRIKPGSDGQGVKEGEISSSFYSAKFLKWNIPEDNLH